MMSSWFLLVALACGLVGAQDPSLQELNTKVQQLTTKVEELQREVSARPQVAFSAALLETQQWTIVGPFDADKTLEFKKVVTNIGNGYDPETAEMMSSYFLLVALACSLVGAQNPADVILRQLISRVEQLERDSENTVTSQVAFSVALLEQTTWTITGPVAADQTLVYKKVLTNIGNAYDTETGVFTAPVKGLYYLRITGVVGSSMTLRAGLKKNGEDIFEIKAKDQGSGSNGAALELEKGDRVYVRLMRGSAIADQSRLSTFTGFLVFPMESA
ncbi:cerebellin-2-like [Oryzias latipes]